jgi:hypothetical protein
VVSITLAYVPLDLILPDQPNRAVRTRMLRGVGGAACEGRPYPDMFLITLMLQAPFVLLYLITFLMHQLVVYDLVPIFVQ